MTAFVICVGSSLLSKTVDVTLKYLSRILTNLHRTSRTGLIFLSRSKLLQGVLCYDQKFNFGHAKSAIKTSHSRGG